MTYEVVVLVSVGTELLHGSGIIVEAVGAAVRLPRSGDTDDNGRSTGMN